MKKIIKNPFYFKKAVIVFILMFLYLSICYRYIIPCNDQVRIETLEDVSYLSFKKDVENRELETVYYTPSVDNIYVLKKDGTYYKVNNPDDDSFKKYLLENDLIVKKTMELLTAEQVEAARESTTALGLLVFILYSSYYLIRSFMLPIEDKRMVVLNKRVPVSGQSNYNKATNAEKLNTEENKGIKKFSDVAGLAEVKKDVACIVDFLINREKYEEAGAKLPRGIILYGPPGTGKTLLAKAIAGEANVPFIYMSGSEFVEMFVGVGAKRVRELFAKARSISPCIVFIDEIDAIGGKRTGHDNGEDRKTINALLTEMDGFKESDNIIIIGATNRLEDLDPALLRPGRFTNKYCVPLPETVKEREEIIKIYSANKKYDETVDINALAKETIGFSPAKIEALLNEASIISVQEGSKYITKKILDKAMYKLILQGHMKEDNTERDLEESKVVAWHEAGHALVGHLLGKDITKVTIIPSTNGAGGVTFSTPKSKGLYSAKDIDEEVMELYAGRIGEYLYYNEDKSLITTGASNDIERATECIHSFVTKYGMSEKFGMLNLEAAKVDNSEIVACKVAHAKRIEEKTLQLLKKNYESLKEIAHKLLEESTIYKKDIEEIVQKNNSKSVA